MHGGTSFSFFFAFVQPENGRGKQHSGLTTYIV